MLLRDKVCLITGAASPRSIGYAAASLFAEQGAKLAILDIGVEDDSADVISASIASKIGRTPDVLALRCDIQNGAECDRAMQDIVAKFNSVDCLIHCAGIVMAQDMLSIGEEDYDRVVDVNLKGTFNICKSALNIFVEKGAGVIVNLASVAAQRGGGLVGGAHYAASKGGVISLTRTIAREFGPQGIRANVICPSMTETGMLDGNISPEMFDQIVQSIPLRRAGKPADIAGVCLFLASELSAYVTGATIDVNGGSHIH